MSIVGSDYQSLWGLEVLPYAGEGGNALSVHFTNEALDDVFLYGEIYETRGQACINLVTLPFRGIGNLACSLINTLALGYFSAKNGMVEDTWRGRFKAFRCSVLSAVASPLSLVVDALGHIENLINPTINKINLLAIHMWTGFIAVGDPNPIHLD